MTLASKLMQIQKATGNEQTQLINGFSDSIKGHAEEKTLRDCMMQAQMGRGFLDFGRNPFIPDALADEGFHVEMAGIGFHLHFD